MSHLSVIFGGIEGFSLSDGEAAFYRETDPWGYILFARNIETPSQVLALTDSLRDLSGRDDVPILIDQEGGRVARLRPPHFRAAPPSAVYGLCYEQDRDKGCEAVRLNSRLFAKELTAIGVNVNCLPVLDVPAPDGHQSIGDRAYAKAPEEIVALGRAAADGLLQGGVLPVIKHMPGQGRALSDSHLELPHVKTRLDDLKRMDFEPFKALKDMPLAMTAHVVYEAIDPDQPATTSPIIFADIIRGEIGYEGLVMTDDLSMKALTGSWEAKARDSLEAGCDIVLHCNGDVAEMEQVASGCRPLSGAPLARANAALDALRPVQEIDWANDLARFEELINPHWDHQV